MSLRLDKNVLQSAVCAQPLLMAVVQRPPELPCLCRCRQSQQLENVGRALQVEGDSPAMDASHAPCRADIAQVAPRRQLHPVQGKAEIGDHTAHACWVLLLCPSDLSGDRCRADWAEMREPLSSGAERHALLVSLEGCWSS